MKRMRAIDANRVFLAAIVFSQGMIYLVSGAGVRDRMVLQILVQVFLMTPAVMYLFMQGVSLQEGLMVRAIGWKEWLLLVSLALCVNQLAEFVNAFSQLFTVNTIGDSMAELIIKYPFPFAFFTIAVVPAVCEEALCRGVLYRGYRKCGRWVAVLLTAFLFGIMHMNPNQFFYACVLGIIFALVNEITGSVLPSVFMHLYINGRSVVILYLSVSAGEDLSQGQEIFGVAEIKEYLWGILPWTVAAVAGIVLIVFMLIRCREKRENRSLYLFRKEEIEPKEERGGFFTAYSPTLVGGVFLCIVYMILRMGS